MTTTSPLALSVIAIVFALWLLSRRRNKPLPPGPPPQFLVGHAFQLKPSHSWLYYTEVSKKYGDVVYFEVFGQPIITLNSFQAVQDLVIKKSAIYSGRPHLTMVKDLAGWEQGFALLQPTQQWQISRRINHRFIGAQVISRHRPLVESEARFFVNGVLNESKGFREHFKFTMARIVLELAYGFKATGPEDEYITIAEEAALIFGLATQPGKWMVDTFPILKHIPAWFPGAGFKRVAAEWRIKVMRNVNMPFERVKANMVAGTQKPCLVSEALENPISGSTDDTVKWMSASLYGGSADTTTATMAGFVLNMILHPNIQEKAQAEIDRVVGSSRLPTFADRKDLPYIDAILKETLRIHPILPMSLPYKALEEYSYRGWIIPKDAIIMANIWAITQDPARYPSPQEFIPERYIDQPGTLDPANLTFGLGRRVCPGQYIADAMLWMTMVTVLATSTMSKARDENGVEITPALEYTGGTISEPVHFPYKIQPRSAMAASLIRTASANAS